MLKTAPRPRAPSAATLRVLYQLAYISSGAAVGIGALCAEERRRRTQIVQRVADNAKRIRQSPRYAHGAAAVAVREQEFEENWRYGFEEGALEGEGAKSKIRRVGGERAVRGPELPSVVEEEYEVLVGKGSRKAVRRRNRSGRPDFVEEHGQRDLMKRVEVDSRRRGAREAPELVRPVLSTPSNKVEADPIQWVSYRRPQPFGMDTEGPLERKTPRTQLFHPYASKVKKQHQDAAVPFDQFASCFSTRKWWNSTDAGGRKQQSEALTKDVDLFFEKINANTIPHVDIQHASRIADHLLRLAIEVGSIDEIRSLLLCKSVAKTLGVNDLADVIGAFGSVAESLGSQATIQFYADLFATRVYRTASPVERFRLNLKLRAEALKLDAVAEDDGLYRNLTDNVDVPSDLNKSDCTDALVSECRQLEGNGHLPSAVKLWCTTKSARNHYRPLDHKFEAELFNAAAEVRHISLCSSLLRLQPYANTKERSRQRDTLIRMAFEDGSTGLLRSLFGWKGQAKSVLGTHQLSPHSCACLARVFAGDNDAYHCFKFFYQKIPTKLRESMDLLQLDIRIAVLKAEWETTRNLDTVRARYQELSKRSAKKTNDERPLHIAMTEIELSANQPMLAMEGLSALNRTGSDGSVAALTALALAKQNDWPAFQRLLQVLASDSLSPSWWNSVATRAFNNALHLFSRKHTAQQLHDLVTMAVDRLSFRPNRSTWKVLLSCFVSKRASTLLRFWLYSANTSNAAGSTTKLDTNLAATLVKTWYLKWRHNHTMVMWLCRRLAETAPSARNDSLLNVVREAIGYDLRTLHGQNALWMEGVIRGREALVANSDNVIPRPGLIWDEQLCRAGPLLTADHVPAKRLASYDFAADEALQEHATAGASEASSEVPLASADLHSAVAAEASARENLGSREQEIVELTENHAQPAHTPRESKDESVADEQSAPSQVNVTFGDLRSSYEPDQPDEDAVDVDAIDPGLQTLERQMILHLSLGQHEDALDLYRTSLDAVGLPRSPMMLEVAVEASLRLHNDRDEAEAIMSAARDAGMNITCAMGPLIIDQIGRMSHIDRAAAAELRTKVMDYYRMNEQNGLHVKHHVGTTAAHALVQAGFAEYGVNLLSTILQSSWSADQPLDITAMSVWLLGYASLGHVQGMHWVIEEVLDQQMVIDMGFIRSLRRARWPVHRGVDGSLSYRKQSPKTMAYLRQWYNVCHRKRLEQMQSSMAFGRQMVNIFVAASCRQQALLAWPNRTEGSMGEPASA